MGEEFLYSEFTRNMQSLLQNGRTADAISAFKNPSNESEIKNNCWDLIPVITQFLSSKELRWDVYDCCRELIAILAEVSNAEEALLQFIEELEEAEDNRKFSAILEVLTKVLVRIPANKINSLAWCFNSIHSYLNKSEIQTDEDLIGKEKLLLDSHDSVIAIIDKYQILMKFCMKVQDLFKENDSRSVLLKFFIQYLGRPLVYINMESYQTVKSKGRIIAEKLLKIIFKLNSDPLSLLNIPKNDNAELYKPDDTGLAILFYLVYSENIYIELTPQIYCPFYLFQNGLHFCVTLLNIDHQISIEKGLSLAQALLFRIKNHKMGYQMLDSVDTSKFCKALAKIIVYNQSKHLRNVATKIYKTYLLQFDIKAFYYMVYNLMLTIQHKGLIGFTIDIFKDVLVREITVNERDLSPYLKNEKLQVLLVKFCNLPLKEETDLIDMSDQITATLNLLRYLVLRDKTNITGIWTYISTIEDEYLKVLRKGIDISRAHYELRVKEINEETGSGDTKNYVDNNFSITVNGMNLKDMSKQEKLTVLNMSLTAFDVIEGLLTRLLECIEIDKK